MQQKTRTRQDLIAAALRLLERGDVPTMPTVAAEAQVSRGTVYRFFLNQQQLLAESLRAFTSSLEVGRESFRQLRDPEDPEARLCLLCELVYEAFAQNEPSFRTFLRYTLEKGESSAAERRLRGRFLWIDLALEPLAATGIDAGKLAALRIQLAVHLGIEAFIVYRDVCELSRSEAKQAATQAALILLRQALA